MLSIGTEISAMCTDGNEHRSFICMFVLSASGKDVFAVTAASFVNSVGAGTQVNNERGASIGETSLPPFEDRVCEGIASLFGFIEVDPAVFAEIDTGAEFEPAEHLRHAQRLFTGFGDNRLDLYVSREAIDVSLSTRALNQETDSDGAPVTISGLSIANLFAHENCTALLSGTPVVSVVGKEVSMVVAHRADIGVLLAPTSVLIDTGYFELLTYATMPNTTIAEPDILIAIEQDLLREIEDRRKNEQAA